MATFLLLNGPNLNLLGSREPEIYGETTLEEVIEKLSKISSQAGHVFNPGAFTHSSIALRDALTGTDIPFIEIHISNIYSREDFRQKSFLSEIAVGIISGLGVEGYELALKVAINRFGK